MFREAHQATAGMAAGRRFGPFAGRLLRVAYHLAAEGLVGLVRRAFVGRLVRVAQQKPTETPARRQRDARV